MANKKQNKQDIDAIKKFQDGDTETLAKRVRETATRLVRDRTLPSRNSKENRK